MASPINPYKPTIAKTVLAGDAVLSTTGVKLTYTCPANRIARILGASWALTGGAAPTIQLKATISGTTIVIQSLAAVGQPQVALYLQAADTCQWEVTIIGAAGVGDLAITVEEYEAL